MKRQFLFLAILFIFTSCGNKKGTGPINTNNVEPEDCEGEAPAADKTEGVCAGQVKICVQMEGVGYVWVEPDYTLIEGYEETEVSCDGLDNDCDGTVDAGLFTRFYRDADGDGFGDPDVFVEACETPDGYVTDNTDCDDTSDDVYPGAPEMCNGIDNNCNGIIDDGVSMFVFYRDADGDGFGDPDVSVEDCVAPAGYVQDNTDCDDTRDDVYPGAPEVCNGIDNNCNGIIDDGVLVNFYRDADGDGFGDPDVSVEACEAPEGYVVNNTDCDDTRNDVYPGAPEMCNGIDNNCNGIIDDGVSTFPFYRDADGDGFGDPDVSVEACAPPAGYVLNNTDCDDTRNDVYPGAPEVCNGIDNNCNGIIDDGVLITFYRDADGDGYGNPDITTLGCTAPAGYVANNTDCDDTRADVYPGAPEVCNGIDNNCNGIIDDGVLITFYRDADGDGYGDPGVSTSACTAPDGYVANNTDCDDTRNDVYPGAPEVCDGVDNNCNGLIDEGVQTMYFRDADGDGFGDSSDVVFACTQPLGYTDNGDDCDDTDAARFPGNPEICDGKDNNCNGIIDDNPVSGGTWYYEDFDRDGYGNPHVKVYACTQPLFYVTDNTDCNDLNPSVYPGAIERCDGVDNNCDGNIDAGECPSDRYCEDLGATVDAFCACHHGSIEDPVTLECHVGRNPVAGDLLITEIMIQPHNPSGENGQYIEILNRSGSRINMTAVEIVVDGIGFMLPVSPLVFAEPGQTFLVMRSGDPAMNGGLTPDMVIPAMPLLVTAAGDIDLEIPGDIPQLLDSVAWDGTWRHLAGRSLSLSPAIIAGPNPMLANDNASAWCASTSVYNTVEGHHDYGTPKGANDACMANFCRLLTPTVQHIIVGSSTDYLNVEIFAEGVTPPAGQGEGIAVDLGFGPRNVHPALSSWTWKPAVYYGDSTIHDLYRERLTPPESGLYDYTFRVTMDGGFSYRYCDKQGNDVYDVYESGGLLVDAPCVPGTTQCSDCIDNDNDGYIDGWDPECLQPSDNDEGRFETGYSSDNQNESLVDCYYDGDSGSGNDKCQTHACCLLDEDCFALQTQFGLGNNTLTKFWSGNWENKCDDPQPQACIDNCLPATPPGCDCFGCCTICIEGECHDILISTPRNFGQCTQETWNDTTKCPRCTLHHQCSRPCDPENCELCPGMTPLDLPAHCTEQVCPDDLQVCSSTSDCPTNYACSFGCCVRIFGTN